MLIGEITKNTKINIFCDLPEGTQVYSTVALERGDTNFELVVKAVVTPDNRIAKFNVNYPIRIELVGNSCICIKVDSIDFNYKNGTVTHIIKSRSRISVPNKRDTFRIPFRHDCTFKSPKTSLCRAKVRDISFEGISIIVENSDADKLSVNGTINIEFFWGLNAVSFDLRCKIVRIQPIENSTKSIIGCSIQTGLNSMRTLIMHLQMEEMKRKRSNYTLRK